MSLNDNIKKGVQLISGILLINLTAGCSYFQSEKAPFLNTRVENGVVILGSDPVIDDAAAVQKEVEIRTKNNLLQSAANSKKSNSNKNSQKEALKAKTNELNQYLLTKLNFTDGDIKKSGITKKHLQDLMSLYALGIDRYASSNQLDYLSKYVVEAAGGSTKHQESIADFYLDGFNGESYEQLAASWYLIAAKSGAPYAQYMLSILYQLGLGLPQDLGQSVVWYKKASESKNSAIAKIRVARRYLYPTSIIHDPKQAFVWMQSAALQGDYEAQYLLADMYLQGKGVEKSEMEAINWYGKAAEQNSAYAQYSLGVMFYNGQGTEQNLLEAKKWLEFAAWQGHSEAQYLLSRMYQQGLGVEKSLPSAYAWLSLINNNEIVMDDYANKVSDLIAMMTPDEKIAANNLYKEYKSKVTVG